MPLAAETTISPGEMADPCGEDSHMPVPGLVHRYPDRVLFLVTDRCASYCRYCTRSSVVSGVGEQELETDFEAAFRYLERHTEVRDVLLSGGDPLLFPDDRLDKILTRLRAIATRRRIGLGLAVVPAWLDPNVADELRGDPNVTVLQHGWAHENHAGTGEKKIELGGSLAFNDLQERLGAGFRKLQDHLHENFLRVLVPPWNRIAPDLVSQLGGLGYVGLSTYGREKLVDVERLAWINTHLDLVHWRGGSVALSFDDSVRSLTELLQSSGLRRVGILTHHLLMDDAAFDALDRLLGLLLDHPSVVWRAPHELFGEPP